MRNLRIDEERRVCRCFSAHEAPHDARGDRAFQVVGDEQRLRSLARFDDLARRAGASTSPLHIVVVFVVDPRDLLIPLGDDPDLLDGRASGSILDERRRSMPDRVELVAQTTWRRIVAPTTPTSDTRAPSAARLCATFAAPPRRDILGLEPDDGHRRLRARSG